jgi:hypothetical protein
MKRLKKNHKIGIFICFILICIHPISFAVIPGDIDGNGIVNLKDCLQLLGKVANSTNDPSINIIQALPLVKGTYSQVRNSEKTTYTFNEDGTCVRVGPDDLGGILTTEGTWHYENDHLNINTSGKVTDTYKVNIDEYYKSAFTNEDASKLILAPPGKSMENLPDILGRYMGEGKVNVTLPDMPFFNRKITIESIIDVESDGSWESVVTFDENGYTDIEKSEGFTDPSMPTIIVFGSSFYPDIFSSDIENVFFVRE